MNITLYLKIWFIRLISDEIMYFSPTFNIYIFLYIEYRFHFAFPETHMFANSCVSSSAQKFLLDTLSSIFQVIRDKHFRHPAVFPFTDVVCMVGTRALYGNKRRRTVSYRK